MKLRRFSTFPVAARLAVISTLSLTGLTQAADLIWDSNIGTAGIQDGGGTWSSAANFSNGTTNFSLLNPAPAVARSTPAFASGVNTLTFADITGIQIGQELSLGQFATGTTVTGITPGTGTTGTIQLSTSSTGNSTSNTTVAFQFPLDSATFGSNNGAAGTVVVSGAQRVKNLTLGGVTSGNYLFQGDSITVGGVKEASGLNVGRSATFENALNANVGGTTGSLGGGGRVTFTAANQTLTLKGGGTILGVSQNNSGISGSSNSIRETSTVSVEAGNYNNSGGAVWNIGDAQTGTGGVRISGSGTVVGLSNLQLGREGGKGGYAIVSTGATLNVGGQVSVGRSSGNFGTLTVDGGTFTNNNTNNGESTMAIGRESGQGKIEIRNGGRMDVIGSSFTNNGGGVVVLNSQSTVAGASGTLDIGPGTAVIKDIRLNGTNQYVAQASTLATAGTAIVNLRTGGNLYLGGTVADTTTPGALGGSLTSVQGGISNRGTGSSTYEINLMGGTLGANAAWSTTLNMTLTGTTTLKAANEANVMQDITLSGKLTGTGGFSKSHDGTVTLNSSVANDFTGASFVTDGRLIAATAGSLGSSNMTVTGLDTRLTLQNANTIFDTAALYFETGTDIDLDFTGADLVGAVINTTTNTSLDGGTYTAAQLNTFFGVTTFTGTGSLTVLIPEPSSLALLGLGGVALAIRRRRIA